MQCYESAAMRQYLRQAISRSNPGLRPDDTALEDALADCSIGSLAELAVLPEPTLQAVVEMFVPHRALAA